MDKEHITKIIQEVVKIARTNKDTNDLDVLYRCIYGLMEVGIIGLCECNIMRAGRIGMRLTDDRMLTIKVWIMPMYPMEFTTTMETTASLLSDEEVVINEEAIEVSV